MVEITDRESLEAWLRTHQLRIEHAVFVANRSALRALPIIWNSAWSQTEPRARLVLWAFRALLICNIVATRSAPFSQFRYQAQHAEDVPRGKSSAVDSASFALGCIPAAAYAILEANSSADIPDASETVELAMQATSSAVSGFESLFGKGVVTEFWSALAGDASELNSPRDLSVPTPLWARRFPVPIEVSWNSLNRELSGYKENWHVWTDWYQDRLDGKPLDEELELKKALIPNELWEQGPAVVNKRIAEIIQEHNAQKAEAHDPSVRDPSQSEQPKSELSETEAGQATRTIISSRTVSFLTTPT